LEAEYQREPEDSDVRVALVIRDVVKRSVLRPVRAKMSEEFG